MSGFWDFVTSERLVMVGLVVVVTLVVAAVWGDRSWRWRRLDPQSRLHILAEAAAIADRRLDEEIDLQLNVEERLSESRERRKSRRQSPQQANTA